MTFQLDARRPRGRFSDPKPLWKRRKLKTRGRQRRRRRRRRKTCSRERKIGGGSKRKRKDRGRKKMPPARNSCQNQVCCSLMQFSGTPNKTIRLLLLLYTFTCARCRQARTCRISIIAIIIPTEALDSWMRPHIQGDPEFLRHFLFEKS
jgi:hypothetical protein